jgi:hypothetical protein
VGAGVTKADCGIAKGYGFLDNKILPCPIGTFNDRAYTAGTTQPCTACPTGSTTSAAGGDNVNSCNCESRLALCGTKLLVATVNRSCNKDNQPTRLAVDLCFDYSILQSESNSIVVHHMC